MHLELKKSRSVNMIYLKSIDGIVGIVAGGPFSYGGINYS